MGSLNPYESPSPLLESGSRPPGDRWVRYVVLAWLCAAAALAYVGRNSLGILVPMMRAELSLSPVELGQVMGAFYLGYAVGQLPGGLLAHAWGTRRSLATFALLWSAACGAIGLADGFLALCVAQTIFGLAQAGAFPAAAQTIAHWLPDSRRAFASGALASCMSLGGALGSSLAVLYSVASWRTIPLLIAAPGILWAIGFWLWFRNRPEEHGSVSDEELAIIRAIPATAVKTRSIVLDTTPLTVLRWCLDFLLICGQQAFRAAGLVFYGTWFPTYLMKTYGVSTTQSGLFAALPSLAIVVGSLLGGVVIDWVYHRTGSKRLSRQGVAVTAMLGCAAGIFAATLVRDVGPAVLLVCLGTFLGAIGGPCGYTVTIDKSGRYVGPLFAVMNMSGNLGAMASPALVVGFVAQNGENWGSVLLLFAGIYVGAAVCWALLNPNGTIFPPRDQPT